MSTKELRDVLNQLPDSIESDIDINNPESIEQANVAARDHGIGIDAWIGAKSSQEDAVGYSISDDTVTIAVGDGVGSAILSEEASKIAVQEYIGEAHKSSEPTDVLEQIYTSMFVYRDKAFEKYLNSQLQLTLRDERRQAISSIIHKITTEGSRQGLFEWINSISDVDMNPQELMEHKRLHEIYSNRLLRTTLKGFSGKRNGKMFEGIVTGVGDSLAYKVRPGKSIERVGANQGVDHMMYLHAQEIADYYKALSRVNSTYNVDDDVTGELPDLAVINDSFIPARIYEESTEKEVKLRLDQFMIRDLVEILNDDFQETGRVNFSKLVSFLEGTDYNSFKELEVRRDTYAHFINIIVGSNLSTDDILQNQEKMYYLLRVLYPGENGQVTKTLNPYGRVTNELSGASEYVELDTDDILILSTDGIDLIAESRILALVEEERQNEESEVKVLVSKARGYLEAVESGKVIEDTELNGLYELVSANITEPDFDLVKIAKRILPQNLSARISKRLVDECKRLNLVHSQDNIAIAVFQPN